MRFSSILGCWMLVAGSVVSATAESASTDPTPAQMTVTDCSITEVKQCFAGGHNQCCPDKGNGIAMDVRVLHRPAWRTVLRALGISASELLAALDRSGVEYDPVEAARVVAELDGSSAQAQPASWTAMKRLYE